LGGGITEPPPTKRWGRLQEFIRKNSETPYGKKNTPTTQETLVEGEGEIKKDGGEPKRISAGAKKDQQH